MVPWWSLPVLAGILAVMVVSHYVAEEVGRFSGKRMQAAAMRKAQNRYEESVRHLKESLQRNGKRYEVRIVPWTPEDWRWAIFDADAAIYFWEPERPQEPPPGTVRPFAEGVGRTRADAEAQALYWIAQRTIPEMPAPVVIPATPDTSTWP